MFWFWYINCTFLRWVRNRVRIVLYFGPEKCLKESRITWRVASKRHIWSRFREKTGPNLHFENISLTLFEQFEYGPDYLDQTCILTRDHKFWKEKKWTKLVFSKKLLTWFWTPLNTFLGQTIRLNVYGFVESLRSFFQTCKVVPPWRSSVMTHHLNLTVKIETRWLKKLNV